MDKSAGWIIGSIVLAVLVFFGVQLHKNAQNTPEGMAEAFVQQLEMGETDQAYDRLTSELKQNREGYWRAFLAQFKGQTATLVSQEAIDDSFNTYPKDSDPQRFVYRFQQQDKRSSLSITAYKIQNVWVIGELLNISQP